MALFISSEACIGCDLCRSQCPGEAIFTDEQGYQIDPYLCTECVGYFATSRCAASCPVEAISPDPNMIENRAELEHKFRLITQLQHHG